MSLFLCHFFGEWSEKMPRKRTNMETEGPNNMRVVCVDDVLTEFEADEKLRERLKAQVRDRAAFVHISGIFPSHLRPKTQRVLNRLTRHYKKPSSLDGRNGSVKLYEEVVKELNMEYHPMVSAARSLMRAGYVIQGSRGYKQRRPYGKIFMFKFDHVGVRYNQMTVNLDGSTKSGW